MIKKFFYGILVAVIIFIPTMLLAKLVITPSITLIEEYNDNLFLTDSDTEDDFITTVKPRIELSYSPHKTISFDIDYGLSFTFYADHDELNDQGLDEAQRLKFYNLIKPFNRFFIEIADVYQRVPVDVRDPVAPGNLFQNMTDSNVFSISPYTKFPIMPTLWTHLGYRYTNVWYDVEGGNNADSHLAFVSLTKTFPNQLNVSLNYSYLAHRPEVTGDYDSHEGSVSAGYQLMQDLSISGKAGYAIVDFDDDSNAEATVWNAGAEYYVHSLGGFVIGAEYNNSYVESQVATNQGAVLTSDNFLPDRTGGVVNFDILGRNSVTGGITKSEDYKVYIKSEHDILVVVTAYYSVDEFVETDREDEIKGIDAELSVPFTKLLTGRVRGIYENQNFFPDNTEVDQYSLRNELLYKVSRSISAGVGYEYNHRDASTDTGDYVNNIVWLQAKVVF